MRIYKNVVIFFIFLISIYFTEENNIELTIYNQNLALIKDTREIDFLEGINNIKITNIPVQIIPTSVYLKSKTSSSEEYVILEQDYEYDLINQTKLLEKYVGQEISLISKDEKLYEGKLLSFKEGSSYISGSLVLSKNRKITMILYDNIKQIEFKELPEELIAQPTLVWKMKSNKKGKHLIELNYLTTGLRWQVDYMAIVEKEDVKIDLLGWVSIENLSGMTFKEAKLKLIAGNIHFVKEEFPVEKEGLVRFEASARPEDVPFKEKVFFEYYMYPLEARTTLKDKQTKQIKFLNILNIPVKKVYVFDENISSEKVQVKLEFENSKKNNLGISLPAGKVRIYKKEFNESLEFIGEDLIYHTPKDEEVKIYIGEAFDIKAERKQTSYKKITEYIHTESYEITLKNHKKEDIEVKVIEHLQFEESKEWEIIEANYKYQKKDVNTIEFTVPIKRNKEIKIEYTIRYKR